MDGIFLSPSPISFFSETSSVKTHQVLSRLGQVWILLGPGRSISIRPCPLRSNYGSETSHHDALKMMIVSKQQFLRPAWRGQFTTTIKADAHRSLACMFQAPFEANHPPLTHFPIYWGFLTRRHGPPTLIIFFPELMLTCMAKMNHPCTRLQLLVSRLISLSKLLKQRSSS